VEIVPDKQCRPRSGQICEVQHFLAAAANCLQYLSCKF